MEIRSQKLAESEFLQYLGVLIFCTRFKYGDRTRFEFILPACFGKTGITKNRFKDWCRFFAYNAPYQHDIPTAASERLGLFDEFV